MGLLYGFDAADTSLPRVLLVLKADTKTDGVSS